jgi:hypothetical protein
MVIIQEKKDAPVESAQILSKSLKVLAKIQAYTQGLFFDISRMYICERIFSTGAQDDRKLITDKLERLNKLTLEINEACFTPVDFSSEVLLEQSQSVLSRAEILVADINVTLSDIWGMRNDGVIPGDNETVLKLSLQVLDCVGLFVSKVRVYVSDFNKISKQKLFFRVRWPRLHERKVLNTPVLVPSII